MPKKKNIIYREGPFSLVRLPGFSNIRINASWNGNLYRFSTKTDDLREAKRQLAQFRFECEGGYRASIATGDDIDDWRAIAKAVTQRHRAASGKRGLPFVITAHHVFAMMRSTGFRCAVSGVPFVKKRQSGRRVDPWSPSIDRIDNSQGYTIENVRIVSFVANVAMNNWGLDVLIHLAKGVVNTANIVSQEPSFSGQTVDTRKNTPIEISAKFPADNLPSEGSALSS